jgi:RNA-directed DNA polymerase
VVKRQNMLSAWKQVKANKGACGIDNISIEQFPRYAQENWEGIKQSLLEGEYHPSPVKRVEIPKDSGGTRKLGIPTVIDRVIQQAISQVLTPVFDPHFSESSFGFRPGRSAHQAVHKVLKDIGEGYRYVVDIDLEKFFDTVEHDVLMSRVARARQEQRSPSSDREIPSLWGDGQRKAEPNDQGSAARQPSVANVEQYPSG